LPEVPAALRLAAEAVVYGSVSKGVMRRVHGGEDHCCPHGPDQRHDPAPAAVILGTFPHGTLDCEGNEQGKDLETPEDRMEDVLQGS